MKMDNSVMVGVALLYSVLQQFYNYDTTSQISMNVLRRQMSVINSVLTPLVPTTVLVELATD